MKPDKGFEGNVGKSLDYWKKNKAGEKNIEKNKETVIINNMSLPRKNINFKNKMIIQETIEGKNLKIRFFDNNGEALKDIHLDDHGNRKLHPFGEKGEHAHDWVDGKPLKGRELSENEKDLIKKYL